MPERKQEPEKLEFKTFTSAVCKELQEQVHCRDEIFVNCSGNISKAEDVAECGGMKIDVSGVNGFAVFEKGWNDERNKNG